MLTFCSGKGETVGGKEETAELGAQAGREEVGHTCFKLTRHFFSGCKWLISSISAVKEAGRSRTRSAAMLPSAVRRDSGRLSSCAAVGLKPWTNCLSTRKTMDTFASPVQEEKGTWCDTTATGQGDGRGTGTRAQQQQNQH